MARSSQRHRRSGSRERRGTPRSRITRRRVLPDSRPASASIRPHGVGFYDKPLLKFERILETYLGVAPRGFRSFLMAGPLWIKDKLYIDRQIRDRTRLRGADPLLRAPRIARRERVLPLAVRGSGHPDDGRRGRVGDGVHRRWARQRHRDPRRAALARLARPAVLGLHLLHGFQGELRRVQGDGSRPVRRAEVRRSHLPGAAGSRKTARSAQSEVLQLPHRPDHDQRRVRRAVRGPPRVAGVEADAERDGPRTVRPGSVRGGHAPHGAHGPHARPGADEPVPGWRRGAQLRRQRPAAA
jgi:hypothetical protein